jgi:hypothetical protein
VKYTKPKKTVNVEELLVGADSIVPDATTETKERSPKHPRGGKYYYVPEAWMNKLFDIKPPNWIIVVVGLHVYRQWCMRNTKDRARGRIKIGNVALARLGISRQSKYRALDRLEAADLIRQHRHRDGSATIVEVTVLDVGPTTSAGCTAE